MLAKQAFAGKPSYMGHTWVFLFFFFFFGGGVRAPSSTLDCSVGLGIRSETLTRPGSV